MATFVQELLPRAPEEAWPTAIRLLSHTQARTSESTNLDARDTDKNQQIWHAKLVLATTGLHLAQFRQPHRPLAKAVDYADLFIYDEAQQEAALSDLAILGALPRKCLVLRLGDPKQTSGGTGPSDLARRVRLVSDQLALGIRAPRMPCLPQAIPALIQSLLQDDLPQACCPAPQNVAVAEHACDADVDGAPPIGGKPSTDALMAENPHEADVDGAPPIGGKPSTDALMAENPHEADVDGAPPIGGKPSTDAFLSAESARLPLALGLLQITGDVPLRWHTAGDLDACAGERAPHNWSIMLPVSQRVQPGVYTLMALSRYRDALVQRVGPERPLVYQPLVPHILTACYQVVLLPPRDFGEWPPVARDVHYAVALFLQVRAAHPDLIQKHRGAGSLLLTPRLDTQATYRGGPNTRSPNRYQKTDPLLGAATGSFFLHVNNPHSANPYATDPPSVAYLAQRTGPTNQNSWTKATSMQTSTVGGTAVLGHNCRTTLPDTLEVFRCLVAVIPSFLFVSCALVSLSLSVTGKKRRED